LHFIHHFPVKLILLGRIRGRAGFRAEPAMAMTFPGACPAGKTGIHFSGTCTMRWRLSPAAGHFAQAALAALALWVWATAAIAAEPIAVALDQARVVKLPDRVGTIVIGNPLIADVSVQPGGLIVVTGKSYGATNLIALDRSGQVLIERQIAVSGPRDSVVVVYRGVERETYSCAPNCERRITLGDSPAFFDLALGQSGARSSQAMAGGGPR
jgi:hypothetical protein